MKSVLEYVNEAHEISSFIVDLSAMKKMNLRVKLVKNPRARSYEITDGDKYVGFYELTSPTYMKDAWHSADMSTIKKTGWQRVAYSRRAYATIATVDIDKAYRRKGIYSEILKQLAQIAAKVGYAGIYSGAYDSDSGEQPRSKDATAVWEKLVKTEKLATKIEYYDEEYDETLVDFIITTNW